MPINRLRSSSRAKSAIAAIMAASVAGYVALFPGEPPVPDDVALAVKYLVQPWEGRSLKAYKDVVGVVTVCDGDTTNVKMGMVETPEGCNRRTATKMVKFYRAPLVKCIPGFEAKPLGWRGMMDALAWNIGAAAACGSTAAKLGIAGRYHESCDAATRFNKAGNRVWIGLVNRREMGDKARIGEGELCVSGL